MSKFSPLCWILIPLLISIVEPVFAQHKVWHQFTIDNGLPVGEVWNLLQARNGLIWFSSDRGIFYYDGYEFRQPVDTSGLQNTETFFPFEDQQGRIWFTRIDKTVWFVEDDTIRYWKYNHRLDAYRGDFDIFHESGIDDDGTLWLNRKGSGFVTIRKDGELITQTDTLACNFTIVRRKERVYFSLVSNDCYDTNTNKFIVAIYYNDTIGVRSLKTLNISGPVQAENWNASVWSDEELIFSCQDKLYIINGSGIVTVIPSPVINAQVYRTPNNEVYVTAYRGQAPGLWHFSTVEEFFDGTGVQLLPETAVLDIIPDNEGGIWLATGKSGLMYCKHPKVSNYHNIPGLPPGIVTRLASDGDKTIFLGFNEFPPIQMNTFTGEWHSLGREALQIDWSDLYYHNENDLLFAAGFLQYNHNKKWQPVQFQNPTDDKKSFLQVKRIRKSPDGNHLWLSSSTGFYKFELADFSVQRMDFLDSVNTLRTWVVLEDSNGRIWVATTSGLKIWNNQIYVQPPFEHPAIKHQVRDIVMLEDGTLFFATLGQGIVIYQPDNQVFHLSGTNGMLTETIDRLRIGYNGEVFACTAKGLHRITKQQNGIYQTAVLNSKNGLPTDQVLDVVRVGGYIWIATGKGLVRIQEFPNEVLITAPAIKSFTANNKLLPLSGPFVLQASQNNVTLQFQTHHLKSEGDIRYRYRLVDTDTFYTETKQRIVSFPALSPGEYRFEVQALREDQTWSEASVLGFEIKSPWYKTIWFVTISILTFVGFCAWFVRTRLNEDRKRAKVELRMKELELAALRAQMNPHFIFNCLNSIQQFITQHKPEEATRYLSRFAKLVRLALHSSVDGKHSLAEEIHMLDHYLALEQMRFKGAFEYSINADHSIDTESIHIPPLLIQPYIENAVVHGMKGKAGNGHIEVHFKQVGDALEVTITDNGPGLASGNPAADGEHKSVGMKLTRNRLAMMAATVDEQPFQHERLVDESGEVSGTIITVRLPLQ